MCVHKCMCWCGVCGLLAYSAQSAVQELSLTGWGNLKRLVYLYKIWDCVSVCVSKCAFLRLQSFEKHVEMYFKDRMTNEKRKHTDMQVCVKPMCVYVFVQFPVFDSSIFSKTRAE